jgi:hypothetical protein
VYVVVAVLLFDGDHVPEMLLFEVVGKVNVPPVQIGAICVKAGVISGFTVTLIFVIVAHVGTSDEVGVNVYVVDAVLLIAGDHVPVILFVDVVGNVNVPPEQIGATGVKVGVVCGLTVILIVAVVAQVGTAVEDGVNV